MPINESLLATAVMAGTVGAVHALAGPDHYLPFVLLGRAQGWRRRKTLGVALACGVGHIASSLVLSAAVLALGVAATRAGRLEALRGEIAAWGLVGFGVAYAAWGLRWRARHRSHRHAHVHADGTVHAHRHDHTGEHTHPHLAAGSRGAARATPWVLFVLFAFGPCEPLIPLLSMAAATSGLGGAAWVAAVFGAATLGAMGLAVLLCDAGIRLAPRPGLEGNAHVLAGLGLVACGAATLWLGI